MSQGSNLTDKDYLKKAYQVAAQLATDPHTQTGAIIVNQSGKIVAKGASHFPKGVRESKKRWQRPEKYYFVFHAERAAIYDAARKGVKTKGLTMYAPWAACAECARAIIESGIKRVVVHKQIMEKTHGDWLKTIKVANKMFKEAGVDYQLFSGKIGGVKIIFNSKPFYP